MGLFFYQLRLPVAGADSAPFGQLQWQHGHGVQPGAIYTSPELACPGTGAAEQLPEKGKADARVASGVWERAGVSKPKLEVARSLLLS